MYGSITNETQQIPVKKVDSTATPMDGVIVKVGLMKGNVRYSVNFISFVKGGRGGGGGRHSHKRSDAHPCRRTTTKMDLKALSHIDDLASQRMPTYQHFSKTLAYAELSIFFFSPILGVYIAYS